MSRAFATIRTFDTERFSIVVDALPDDDLDLSYDDDGSVRAGLDSGKYIAFCARARCFLGDVELASDYLGGCVYESLEDFARPGGYFSDMVRNVIREARNKLLEQRSIHIRK